MINSHKLKYTLIGILCLFFLTKKIGFNKLTICFGYKCIECFFTFLFIRKSSLPWKIVCLWRANLKVRYLESSSVYLFVCFFIIFHLIYSVWYCQEVYVCKNCMRAMNCALRNLEWRVLLMLYLEEWWIKYKLICFLSRHGLLIILHQWRLWLDEMPCKISCNC
jgi:hypothetical protein